MSQLIFVQLIKQIKKNTHSEEFLMRAFQILFVLLVLKGTACCFVTKKDPYLLMEKTYFMFIIFLHNAEANITKTFNTQYPK